MSDRAELRERAERLWAISVDDPHPSRNPLRRVFARLARPLVDRQRDVNDVLLKLLDDLDREVARTRGDGRVTELEERLLRIERRRPAPSASSASDKPSQAFVPAPAEAPFDYFAFESRMRGDVSTVAARQAVHVEAFRGAGGPVLDAGCGRGEMLRLLASAGIEAYGVDASDDMVAYCLGDGLDARHGDVNEHLERLPEASLGGVFAGQFVEHLQPVALVRFLELAADRIQPGGALVAETINPLTLTALTSYYADLTHAQPLVPHTLELLAQGAGFARVEIRFLNEPPSEQRLRRVELPSDPANADAQRALDLNVARLNELLYGPLDYALVARR